MPRYDYQCLDCEKVQVFEKRFEHRQESEQCECGGNMLYQFPVHAIKGFQPFEDYHDESLGVDIKGRRHKQEVMRAMGVIEAGDKVHGGRNWDENAGVTVRDNLAPIGRTMEDVRRETEKREEDAANFAVGTANKDGTASDIKRADDLPNG